MYRTTRFRQVSGGGMVLANAGHLMPYAGGAEVTLEAGLPLGIVETEYAETTGQFQSLLLLSDGAVEAARPNGELCGFERTREISARSAVTVVTVCAGRDNELPS